MLRQGVEEEKRWRKAPVVTMPVCCEHPPLQPQTDLEVEPGSREYFPPSPRERVHTPDVKKYNELEKESASDTGHTCNKRKSLYRSHGAHMIPEVICVVCCTLSALLASRTFLRRLNTFFDTTTVLGGTNADMACLIGFGTAATCLYRSCPGDRYKDHRILTGIIGGMLIGLGAGMEFRNSVFEVLPWTILTSLLISGFVHKRSRPTEHGSWPEACTDMRDEKG